MLQKELEWLYSPSTRHSLYAILCELWPFVDPYSYILCMVFGWSFAILCSVHAQQVNNPLIDSTMQLEAKAAGAFSSSHSIE